MEVHSADVGNNLMSNKLPAIPDNIINENITSLNKKQREVAASNIGIKKHQLFSRKQILGVHVTIVQREILGDLTQTCF